VDVRAPPQPKENPGTRPAARRWQAVAEWVAGGLMLFAFCLRVSFGERVDSEATSREVVYEMATSRPVSI
jgi:hypothetical protein